MREKSSAGERRKYLRLDSVFPVQFRLISPDEEVILSDWIQGFTHNVSKEGIRLDVNNLKPQISWLIKNQEARVSLRIKMPLTKPVVNAQARVVWVKDNPEGQDSHFIGLTFDNIGAIDQKRITRYARTKRMFLPLVLTIIFILSFSLTVGGYLNLKLIAANKSLVGQLIKILQETNIAKQKIKDINSEKDELQLKIAALELRMRTIEEEKADLTQKVKAEEVKSAGRINELNSTVEKLNQEKTGFQEQLIVLQHKESIVTEELLRLDAKKVLLEKANIDKMYRWLAVRQNPRTGLVISFEADKEIASWAFIYDQSLVLQTYINFSDFERARKILEFFRKKAKRKHGLFFNAYHANDGSPAEYIVQSGTNIWLGIAVLQYTQKTQDTRYLNLAEEIARTIINLQNQGKEGGIRGGPDIEWYSTEHNLDGYAFFDMLYKITGKQIYLEARDKVLNWFIKNTYNEMDVSVIPDKADSTIATVAYGWSIAAIGPEKLNELGMNPDKIMEFIEEHYTVEASFLRLDGQTIKIKGFDFAPQGHISRGGVVSSQWTAQMIIAFRVMADFYHRKNMTSKAAAYENKADEYLIELCNMIIPSSSPSSQGESCLPCGSGDFVDIGGRFTRPKDKSAGCVSGTAYTIFAYYHYNPLELED